MTVAGPFNETISAEGILDVVNVDFVPWGNAYYNTEECHTSGFDKERGMDCWVKQCGEGVESPPSACFDAQRSPILAQHGESESKADLLEGCVIDLYPDAAVFGSFLVCFEGQWQSDPSAAGPCAKTLNIDMDRIHACMETKGAEIDARNARRTALLGTSKIGTPWIMINGVNLKDPSTMLKAVCSAVEAAGGKLPKGCN